jgi:hypothetical protein
MGRVVPFQPDSGSDAMVLCLDPNTITARAVIARPGDFSADDQASACHWLITYGDWMDYERARHLLRLPPVVSAGPDRRQRKPSDRAAGLIALLLLGLLIAHVAPKAWGQFQHDLCRPAVSHP